MTNEKRLEIGLFVMRLSIGIFVLALIIQKSLTFRPTTSFTAQFSLIETSIVSYPLLFIAIGLIIVFLSGLCKTFSYGTLLGLQLAFIGSMYKEMLHPQQPGYTLFWAGIPLTGALMTLFLLRDNDDFLSFNKKNNQRNNLDYKKCYWQYKQRTLEILSQLSHRTGEFSIYLKEIATGVSELIEIDSSVITICQEGFAQVLASNVEIPENNNSRSLHGQLTGTVVDSGKFLVVEDTQTCTEYGRAPEGCRAYLGIPLRTSQGKVIGTICCFHTKPRKFSPQEIEIIELFAERAATAIDNHYLYQQQRQFNRTLEVEVTKKTEELKVAQAKLVERERLAAIGEFAASIIHEIRNPFCTIKLVLEYFNKIDLSEQVRKRLNLAVDEAKRLEKLLEEILLYAKPQILDIKKIEINQCIDKVLELQRNHPEVINKNKHIDFYPGAEEPKIQGDEDKIKQVLINIIHNACEAINSGEKVKLQVHSNLINQEVSIKVNNGGEPIPKDILPLLTQPFFSTKSSGTGLGLAITKRIVEAHNGEFMIESNAEEGTSVTIKLPMIVG